MEKQMKRKRDFSEKGKPEIIYLLILWIIYLLSIFLMFLLLQVKQDNQIEHKRNHHNRKLFYTHSRSTINIQ